MSVETVMARIATIQGVALPQPPAPAPAGAGPTFASQLAGASGVSSATVAASSVAGPTPVGGGSVAQRLVQLAQNEVGVKEQPPGSNDSPRISEYRSANPGGGVGPWCVYFLSWAAKGAGAPLGEAGQGFANVSAAYGWAQRTGRALPAGAPPQPGDFIVWGGRHIGMVESVEPDGTIKTIEGNSSDAVSRRTYGPDGGGATGYIRL